MRIAQVLISNSWGNVGPEALEKGIGGREGSMVYLAREWAKLGHEVTNFVNTERGNRFTEEDGFHEYLPLNMTKPMLANQPWDVCIAWECPSAWNDPRVSENIGLKIVEMQVAHLEGEEAEAAARNADYIAALSPWHAEFIQSTGVEVPADRYVVFPNGCDLSRYDAVEVNAKRLLGVNENPYFVYSSSPDRGLWGLLQSWKYIRKEFPGARLDVGYGASKWIEQVRWSHGRVGEMAVELETLLFQPGVSNVGKIGQGDLSRMQLKADAWLYPLDAIQATETGCITAVENAAAGNPILTTDCDCMASEFGGFAEISPLPFDPEDYANRAISLLRDEGLWRESAKLGRQFAETRDWKVIAPQWLEFFKSRI